MAINARRPGPAAEVIQQIEALGQEAIFEQADITDYQEVKKMVSNVLQRLGKTDILVVSGGATGELKPNFFPVTSNDVAEAALFFASSESDQVTGQILSLNGGLSFPG